MATMTAEMTTIWTKRIRKIAAYWVWRWNCQGDRQALVDDLTAVGWIAVLTYGPRHRMLVSRLHTAMRLALTQWRTNRRRPAHRAHYPQWIALGEIASQPDDAVSPMLRALWRVEIDQLAERLPEHCRVVWREFALEGKTVWQRRARLDGNRYRQCGLSQDQVFKATRKLRRVAMEAVAT